MYFSHQDCAFFRYNKSIDKQSQAKVLNRRVLCRICGEAHVGEDQGVNRACRGLQIHLKRIGPIDCDIAMSGTCFEGIKAVVVAVSLHLDINIALVSGIKLNMIKAISAWERDLDVDAGAVVAVVKQSLPLVQAVVEHRVEGVAWRVRKYECKLDLIKMLLDRWVTELVRFGYMDVLDSEIIVQVDENIPCLVK